MAEDSGEEFDTLVPIVATELVIDNHHFHGCGTSQRSDLTTDHP